MADDKIAKTAPDPPEKVKPVAAVSFWVFAAGLLGFIGFFGYRHQPTEMGIAATACCMGLIFSQLTRFSRFKGLGIDAELREVVERAEVATQEATATTQEAVATLDQLREVSKTLGRISTEMLARMDLIGSIPDRRKLQIFSELANALRKLNIEADLDGMGGQLFYVIKLRHMHKIQKVVYEAAGPEAAKASELMKPLADYHREYVANAAHCRSVVEGLGYSSAALEAALIDYEHFEKLRTLRRPEIWEGE